LNGITEIAESRDKASGLSGFGSAVEVIGAEILIKGGMREHVGYAAVKIEAASLTSPIRALLGT
jgi:hypothetical protein